MKQTALEFLQESLSLHFTHEQQMQFEGLFQQAKEMEQQQLNNAWQEGASEAQSDAAKEIEKNYVARVR